MLGTGGEATLYLDGQRVQDASILQHLRSQDIASVEVINTPGAQYKASTNSVIKIHTIKKQNMTSLSASQYALLQNRPQHLYQCQRRSQQCSGLLELQCGL